MTCRRLRFLHLAACRLALSAAMASVLAVGCAPSTSLTYNVAPAPGNPGQLEITLTLNGVSRDSLALRGYASDEVLRVSDFQAFGPRGARIAGDARVDTVLIESLRVDVPRFTLRGPLPPSLTVRYRVTPGRREGDSHMGFTGRCFGYVGEQFALVSGREIFLLPDPGAEAIRHIEVRFSLPSGWKAATTWESGRDNRLVDLRGSSPAEQMISATVGLGPFHERTFRLGDTRFTLAFPNGIPPSQEEQAVVQLTGVARYVHRLFGRDLGRSYMTIIVPTAPSGDEIAGEGSATGQGQTFSPLTGNRLHDFAARLIDAYIRYAPYRTEVRAPGEYWLVDGITNLYAWRAVAAAGLMGEDELNRSLAAGYLSAFTAEGVERNLENLYGTTKSNRLEREALAPFVLLHLDRTLRSVPGEKGGFDSVLARMFHGRTAPSLWSSLPQGRPGLWQNFRAWYVRGTTLAPVERYIAIKPTQTGPEPSRGRAVREVTLVYTGETFGYLENCGCKVNQSGGAARRATVIRHMRERDPGLLLLDAGSAFIRPEKQEKPDFFSRREQSLYLRLMDFMRYGAAVVGTTELSFGLEHFREMTHGIRTPYLSANILEDGKRVASAWTLLSANGLRVAVIGLFEPLRGKSADPLFESHTSSLLIENPLETLRGALPALRSQADLVIAMGRLTPVTIRRLVAACTGVDVIISTDSDAPTFHKGAGGWELSKEDPPGFLGGTLVLYTPLRNYGFSSARLGLDQEGRITSAAIESHMLYHDVKDDPVVRERLNRFYDEVGKLDAAQASVKPLFQDDPARLDGRYVGAAQCKDCHQTEYIQWKTTGHASAYKTLLDVHRHYQPRCISCHVVGYGTPHGYRIGAPEEPLGNVQCEICHGPGGPHVAAPSRSNIRRVVPEKVCLECHNPDHSDHFVYAERLPKVRHDYFEEGHALLAPAGAK